jgi:hypothetical protein
MSQLLACNCLVVEHKLDLMGPFLFDDHSMEIMVNI